MTTMELFEQLLSRNKMELEKEKAEVLDEINDHVEHYFEESNVESLFNIRQFIDEKQSYFALSCTLAPPILRLNDIDISVYTPSIIRKAYQDAIKINEDLRLESEKIYSDLYHSFLNKSS